MAGAHAFEQSSPARFNRDVRPILSDKCFKCHGPDAKQRKGDLRLDLRDRATAERDGPRALVPGDPAGSELIARVTHADPDERMPPADSGLSLTEGEIGVLRRWVAQGAEYEPHWAFVAPVRPALPPLRAATVRERSEPGGEASRPLADARGSSRWFRNAIDAFVLARLEQEGLTPSPAADKTTLIRRVTLDLTGLPPTPREVDAFVSDASPDAYEKLVDRLLDSPRYGERMAVPWLDAARYADTHGYLFDTERFQWRWRDWVIAAFNRNQPFDRFTVEQLAGDMLPAATLDQKIASGFNRNHIINTEFGALGPEYFVENIFDRVETTATVWMGLTMQCARCHDHKYDPMTQKEYYELYAFFNNVPEVGVEANNKNADPLAPAPTDEQERAVQTLGPEIARIDGELGGAEPDIRAAQAGWEREFLAPQEPPGDAPLAYWALNAETRDAAGADRAKVEGGPAKFGQGLLGDALSLDGKAYLNTGDTANFDRTDAMTLAAWVRLEARSGLQTLFARVTEAAPFRGYALQISDGALLFALIHQFPDSGDLLQVKSAGPGIAAQEWRHVAVTYDGSGKAAGVRLYIDGQVQEVQPLFDALTGPTTNDRPLLVGSGPAAPFKGLIDEPRIYARALSDREIGRLPGVSVQTWLAIDPAARTGEQARRVRDDYLTHHAPPRWREPHVRIKVLRERLAAVERAIPTVMVMRELDMPRDAFILTRGAYDKPAGKVSAGTPSALPPLPGGLPRNRLGLAQWLTDPAHPLTARVIVNRYWQMYFGTGIVKTVEDLGLQGEWPSHPELLDWLATEFIRTGWDVKAMQRLIVTSATYRQSAAADGELFARDPENRLLARGPRVRLDAELIRDQAMAAGGLLVERIGGPSVKPYEPPELWREVAFDTTGKNLTAQIYLQDQGPSLYRRGLYTFWKRTSPPATMQTFDAPDRERCVVRRDRTNTPLQALVVMNDPTYVEASRKLAERMMREGGSDPVGRITYGHKLLTARALSAAELAPLMAVLDRQRARFAGESSAAESLLGVGESPRDPSLDPAELAAYTVVANILLNLDEVLTKG